MGYRFTFRLFPEEKSEQHTHLVYTCLCELFFDLASYPCEIRFTAVGLGYMLTRDTLRVTNAADCLDEWEEVFDFVQNKNGSCWLYLELSCLQTLVKGSKNFSNMNESEALCWNS